MQILSRGNGGTREALTKQKLNELSVIFPETLGEQARIATALSDIDELISTLQKLIEKKRNIKQGTMQNWLSGRIRLSEFKEPWIEKTLNEI